MKLLLVVLVFAAVTYLAVRWLQDHGHGDQPARRRTQKPQPPTRPVAPDDDDSFLRDLEWRRRQQERHRDRPQPPDTPDA
ncbi:hypothetical protein [Nocardioides nitrophenolicus]|uniref:hypothetical protein n=1 Tax=Nocardioides nitrophenolicus TaxID=60489 RepID=UPI001958A706|nr:hypothetical protein [Nocardioides nitrophenolicus]MBM7518194.1 hypothetical protein [Nocardioides nitrophenolicus]